MTTFDNRNSFASIDSQPVTADQIVNLRYKLGNLWEDTDVVTKPNGIDVITVGNLQAIIDTLWNHMRAEKAREEAAGKKAKLRLLSVGADRHNVKIHVVDSDDITNVLEINHERAFALVGELQRAIKFPSTESEDE